MMDFGSQSSRVSLTTQVERRLKQELITGAIRPGTRLITKYIAAELDVSITPVREALLRLAAFGALEVTPAQMFVVPQESISYYQEMNFLRKNLETLALQHAISKLDEEKMNALQLLYGQFLNALQGQADSEQVAQALNANLLLRMQLYSYAEMPTLQLIIEQLWVRLGPGFHFLWPQSESFKDIYHQHYDTLFTALSQGNSQEAINALGLVIDKTMAALLRRHYGN